MQMLRPHLRHLRRTFQTGLWLQYRTTEHQVQLHAKINRLQIDNQLSECVFPVILAPVAPPKSIAQSSGTFLKTKKKLIKCKKFEEKNWILIYLCYLF